MHVDKSRGTFEDILRNSTPAAADIAFSLRRLIQDLFPDVTEVPRPAEQHADYGIGTGKTVDVFAYICPVKTYVRLGFYYGANLADPAGMMVGTGKRLRHIKLNVMSDVQCPAVQELLIAAYNGRKSESKSQGFPG